MRDGVCYTAFLRRRIGPGYGTIVLQIDGPEGQVGSQKADSQRLDEEVGETAEPFDRRCDDFDRVSIRY